MNHVDMAKKFMAEIEKAAGITSEPLGPLKPNNLLIPPLYDWSQMTDDDFCHLLQVAARNECCQQLFQQLCAEAAKRLTTRESGEVSNIEHVDPDIFKNTAILNIYEERQRQIDKEGWTVQHDDEHNAGEMALAAACYALSGGENDVQRKCLSEVRFDKFGSDATVAFKKMWRWDMQWWKPKDRRCDLIRAGALIVAEIERLDRNSIEDGSAHG